eukprot:augustus_masked-scaffold_15-processed-gene-9.44-mRNA-1 protein AED:0.10 eAED:0.22 QI:0/-1/0/1/-1/1/1/0/556
MSDDFDSAGDLGNSSSRRNEWKFSQWFRKMAQDNEEDMEMDRLTAVSFDETGRFLVTGDRQGNVVILESDESKSKKGGAGEKSSGVHYQFYSEFASHYPDFDFVSSLNIEEKIVDIQWGPKTNGALNLLTTNDKVIKLWKVREREKYKYVNWNIAPNVTTFENSGSQPTPRFNPEVSPLDLTRTHPIITELKVPKKVVIEKLKMPILRKTYASDVHEYNISSLSTSADKETFLSADNLRVNLWSLHVQDQSYNVLDIKPDDMQELSEIISCIDFHPSSNNQFLYSSSLGNIRICDLRTKALVDTPSKTFLPPRSSSVQEIQQFPMVDANGNEADFGTDQNQAIFFEEMVRNVTSAKFSKGGRFIISRDYMSIKIWDINMETKPVETIYVHEFLRDRMWDLYSNELLWDSFGMGISARGDVVTGTYNNHFHVFNLLEKTDAFIEATRSSERVVPLSRSNKPKIQNLGSEVGSVGRSIGQPKKKGKQKGFAFNNFFKSRGKKKDQSVQTFDEDEDDSYPWDFPFEDIDFQKKILNCAWHPEANTIAVAGQNNLYIYTK